MASTISQDYSAEGEESIKIKDLREPHKANQQDPRWTAKQLRGFSCTWDGTSG